MVGSDQGLDSDLVLGLTSSGLGPKMSLELYGPWDVSFGLPGVLVHLR